MVSWFVAFVAVVLVSGWDAGVVLDGSDTFPEMRRKKTPNEVHHCSLFIVEKKITKFTFFYL